MAYLPLIERELRVALRKQKPADRRLLVAGIGAAAAAVFMLADDRGAGQTLARILCVAGCYFVVRVPMLIAGTLAEERRHQTLGLLFLSGLGAGEVFVSKFLSSAAMAFGDLLAIYPLLALPFLIGGVSYDLFLAIIFMLPLMMLFAVAISLLASALTREEGSAVVLANVIGAALALVTPAIYRASLQFSPLAHPSVWWLRLSVAYGPYLVMNGFGSGFPAAEQKEFWTNSVLTCGWTFTALAMAAFALQRLWRDRDEAPPVDRNGDSNERQIRRSLAELWLDNNPCVWLAARSWQPARLAEKVIGGITLVWIGCWAVWRGGWLLVPNLFLTAVIINAVLFWLVRHTAAQEIALARRDGAYELLLTTPIGPEEVVWGELQSLRCRFQPLSNKIILGEAAAMLAGLPTRSWSASSLIVYFTCWAGLMFWTWNTGRSMGHALPVMWVSLNCGRPAYDSRPKVEKPRKAGSHAIARYEVEWERDLAPTEGPLGKYIPVAEWAGVEIDADKKCVKSFSAFCPAMMNSSTDSQAPAQKTGNR